MKKVKQTPVEIKIGEKICKIPLSWDDINLRQYMKLITFDNYNDVKFLSIMLDVSEEEIKESEIADLDLIVYPLLGWYADDKADDFGKRMSSGLRIKEVTISGKVVKVPEDIRMKTFGQKISCEQSLESNQKNPLLAIPDIIAIYLYPEFSEEKYDYEKSLIFRDEYILLMPIKYAYPIGRFFLMTLKELLSKKLNIWAEVVPKKKLELISKNLINLNILK